MIRRSILGLGFLLAAGASHAQCAGPGGVPFNCKPGNAPQLGDIMLGGSNTMPQSGQTVTWTLAQVKALIGGAAASLSSPPPIGNIVPNTGTFTTLAQVINTTWVGGYPGVNNVGLYSTQTYTGTPTGGFTNSAGVSIPFNLINVTSDHINWTSGGGVTDLFVKGVFGGGAASGDRAGLIVDLSQVGSMASAGNYAPIQVYASVFANVTGAASGSGNGLGSWNGIGVDVGHLQANIWVHEITGLQVGLAHNDTTSSTDYLEFVKWVDGAPPTWNAYLFSAFETFSQVSGHFMKYGLTLGDPQSPGTGFPFTTTSTFIYAFTGNLGIGIDMSNVTFTTAFMKGPNGFQVLGNNWVYSDAIHGTRSNTVSLLNADTGTTLFAATGAGTIANFFLAKGAIATGTPILATQGNSDANVPMAFRTGGTVGLSASYTWQNAAGNTVLAIQPVASPVSGFNLVPAASGPVFFDVFGTPAPLDIGVNTATAVNLGGGSAPTNVLGQLSAVNMVTSCSGQPTGTLRNNSGVVNVCP